MSLFSQAVQTEDLTNGDGGRLAGSVSCGIETQLSTHFPTAGFGVIAPT